MKKILIALAAFAVSASVFAQGTITYYNRGVVQGAETLNIPILLDASLNPGPGEGPGRAGAGVYSVGLFLKTGDSYSLITTSQDPLVNPVGVFRTAVTPNDLTGYMTGGITLVVPTVAAGSSATFQLRAWLTSAGSYDNTLIRGSSADLVVAQLGGSTPGGAVATPNLGNTALDSFTITPEPSTYALGIAALGALAFLRRRK